MDEELRTRMLTLSEDELKALLWQCYGWMTINHPNEMDTAIIECLPGIEARRGA